jgi:hypothetical protein
MGTHKPSNIISLINRQISSLKIVIKIETQIKKNLLLPGIKTSVNSNIVWHYRKNLKNRERGFSDTEALYPL